MNGIWTTRLVGKDGLVIRPDQVFDIIFGRYQEVVWRTDEGEYRYTLLKNLRPDQYTGFHDKNGTMIYENDIVKHLLWGAEGVIYAYDTGGWKIQTPTTSILRYLSDCAVEFEVIGHVPYAE